MRCKHSNATITKICDWLREYKKNEKGIWIHEVLGGDETGQIIVKCPDCNIVRYYNVYKPKNIPKWIMQKYNEIQEEYSN